MNLIGEDILLMRERYDEALEMLGVPALYQYPINARSNAQGESLVDLYSSPQSTSIFFEASPKIKTLKRLGWVVENNDSLPFLIYCSFNLPELQRDCIFELAGQYTGLPARKFRATELSYDIVAADHMVCQVVPVYQSNVCGETNSETKYKYNSSNSFLNPDINYRGKYSTYKNKTS